GRGARLELAHEPLGVARGLDVEVGQDGAVALARDPGLGEEGEEAEHDRRVGPGHLDPHDMRRHRRDVHPPAAPVVAAEGPSISSKKSSSAQAGGVKASKTSPEMRVSDVSSPSAVWTISLTIARCSASRDSSPRARPRWRSETWRM